MTGAGSFSLGNSYLKLNSLWTVLLLPLCDQPGLRTTENNFALSFSRFLLTVLFSLVTDANRCGRKSKLFNSTWSRIIDISGETTIIVEFSKVREALAERGNSWKIKRFAETGGHNSKNIFIARQVADTRLACDHTKKINNARQRGFIKITRTIRVGHLGDDKLMTTLLGDDVNYHNWPIRGYIRSWYTVTGR